jgi:phthiodiolone/phenolphthiodiolone dimycocerosates ketoreductase
VIEPVLPIQTEANTIRQSGVVDHVEVSDQPVGFLPPCLWNEANAPAAAIIDEPDSLDAGIVTATIAATSAPGLGLTIGTDCIRTPPAELVQTMWSLAKLRKGKALFHIGAGEVKQCAPYGHKRSEGLARMEDLCRIFNLLWEADGPVDFEGNHTTTVSANRECYFLQPHRFGNACLRACIGLKATRRKPT